MGRDAVSDAAANGDAQTSAKSAVRSTRTAARPRPDAAVSEFVFFIFLPRIIPIAIKIAAPPPFTRRTINITADKRGLRDNILLCVFAGVFNYWKPNRRSCMNARTRKKFHSKKNIAKKSPF
jgi:hypothetical protein